MWGDPAAVTEETLSGYSQPLLRPGIFEHAVRIVQSWNADMAEFEASLPKISHIRTLLVWGSRDRVVAPPSAEILQRSLPGSRIAIIEDAGHLPYEERPEEFSRIVHKFLLKHFPSGATRKVT
jgi:pimeloyl-ACP methyl ester carboxylesterase